MESISYLNGLEETPLPAITAGTANEYIRVNSNESAYELAQPSDILPSQTGVSSGSLLSTNGTNTSWSNNLNLSKIKLAAGSRTEPSLVWNDPQDNTGFYGDGNDSIIYAANGNNQVKFTTGGLQLYGSAGARIRGLSSNDTILSNGSFGFSGQDPVIEQITSTTQSARITVGTNNIQLLTSASSNVPVLQVTVNSTDVTCANNLNIAGGTRASGGLIGGSNGYCFSNQPFDGLFYKNSAPVSLNLRRLQGSLIELTGSATEAYETIFRTNPAAANASGATERMRIGNTQISASLPINITHTGSATTPSLMFGDASTGRSGLYANPTNNTLNFSTDDVERMSIDTTGIKLDTVRAASGSQVNDKGYVFDESRGSGLQWETTTGGILHLCYANATMIGMSSNTVSINATSINANGTLTCSNKINALNGSSGGIGLANLSTQVDFNSTGATVNLRSNGTVRVQASSSGVSLTGNTTVGSGTFTVNGGLANFGQAARVTGNLTVQSGNLILGTNDIASAATINSDIFKTATQGSSTLCAVRVNENNCGLYQSNTGNLDIAAGGVNGLNINSTRVQTANILNFNRCPAYQANIQTGGGSFSITTITSPLNIIFRPISGNADSDFSAATNYFAGQQFQIITRDVSGNTGTLRYRAQSDTIHITGGAAAITISANTYHTLTLDRYHIVICNVDTNRFYLIQT